MKKITTTFILILFSFIYVNGQETSGLIIKKYDKYEDKTTYHTPLFGKFIASTTPEPVVCYKMINKDKSVSYYLKLQSVGYTSSNSSNGVVILFTDNTKLDFPYDKVDVKYDRSKGNYEYSSFILLNEETLNTLENKQIEGFKLYVYENNLSSKKSLRFMDLVKEIRQLN